MRKTLNAVWRLYCSRLLSSLPNTVYFAATALVMLFISHRLTIPFADAVGSALALNAFVYALGAVSWIAISLSIVTLIAGDIRRLTGDTGRFPD